jgi:hypothetical protein
MLNGLHWGYAVEIIFFTGSLLYILNMWLEEEGVEL